MGKFSSFSQTALRKQRPVEDDDPMSGLANLSDCMLVLACGLMVALVVAWNIDINDVKEMSMVDQVHEVSEMESIEQDINSGGSSYIDLGRIYQDPETGKYYMVENPSSQSEEEGSTDE